MTTEPILEPVAPFTVLRVVDTRDVIEHDDRFVPIPGSGDARECDRCGRTHEIHAYVTDARGAEWIVGVGCVDADAAPDAKRLARAATAAATAAAKDAATAAASARVDQILAAVRALPFPLDRVAETGEGTFGRRYDVEDAYVWSRDGLTDERLSCLAGAWRRNRALEMVGDADTWNALLRRAGRSILEV